MLRKVLLGLVISVGLLSLGAAVVKACTGHKWVPTSETSCVSDGICGTTSGTKSVTYTCQNNASGNDSCSPEHQEVDVPEHWSCPTNYELYYSDSSHKWRCKDTRYADKIDTDPRPGHTDWECPSNDSAYTSQNSSKACSREFKEDATKIPATYKTVPAQTKIVNNVSCTLENPDYSSCNQAGECPTACGLEASQVSDGKGGYTQCQATEACPVSPTPTPTEPSVTPEPTQPPSQPGIGGGPVGAPQCNDTKPGTPTLISVVSLGGNQIKITWTKVSGANNYTIYYGPSGNSSLYSVPSTGDTDNFTINGLATGCFTVNAVNGCQPGDRSAEACTGGTGGGNVLGASTMAGTGAFESNLFSFLLLSGLGLLGFGTKRIFSK